MFFLRRAKVPRSNLTKAQRIALKELRELEEQVILLVDKGNTTVMMRCGYDRKIEVLDTSTYGKLRDDPTVTQENSWSCKLKGLERNQEITSALYNKFSSTGSQLPRIYGVPKIHKPDVPLRNIISCTASPTYPAIQPHHTPHIPPSRAY